MSGHVPENQSKMSKIKTITKKANFGIKTITKGANFGIKTNFDGFFAHLAIRGMAGICFCALTALMASHRCWALRESEFLRTSRTILDSTAKASVATVTVFAVVNVANMIFEALIHTLIKMKLFWRTKEFLPLFIFLLTSELLPSARVSSVIWRNLEIRRQMVKMSTKSANLTNFSVDKWSEL